MRKHKKAFHLVVPKGQFNSSNFYFIVPGNGLEDVTPKRHECDSVMPATVHNDIFNGQTISRR